MEYLKNKIKAFIGAKTTEKVEIKKTDKYTFLSQKLLSKHKVNEQFPYEGDLEENEWRTICRACFDVVKFKELKTVKEHLVNDVISDAIRHVGSMDDVNFNRATINGIELFYSEIERLALLYRAEVQERKESRITSLDLDELTDYE